jgi:hypothetical protein
VKQKLFEEEMRATSLPRTNVQLITIYSLDSGQSDEPDEARNNTISDKIHWNFFHSFDAKAASELLELSK